MADPFDLCDRCEAAIVALLGAETPLADVQMVRLEDDEIGETDHIRACCEGATEYQRNSGIWVVSTKVKLSVHAMDEGARDRLLTYWKVVHQALRRTDLGDALSGSALRVAGARGWGITRSREGSSWVREISCELLAHLRA